MTFTISVNIILLMTLNCPFKLIYLTTVKKEDKMPRSLHITLFRAFSLVGLTLFAFVPLLMELSLFGAFIIYPSLLIGLMTLSAVIDQKLLLNLEQKKQVKPRLSSLRSIKLIGCSKCSLA